MARARNIKPGFFTNADLIECEPLARLLFAGLWCEADRRGILEDRPKTLKIKILPGDNCDVDALLTNLDRAGFIQRYELNGQRCILIRNFEKHQHPHQNEQPNNLPAPEQHQSSTVQAPEQSGVNVNLLPHTDSLTPHTENANGATAPPAEDYRSLIGDDYWSALDAFKKVDPALSNGWLDKALKRAPPGLSPDRLFQALENALNRVGEDFQRNETQHFIKSKYGWANTIVDEEFADAQRMTP